MRDEPGRDDAPRRSGTPGSATSPFTPPEPRSRTPSSPATPNRSPGAAAPDDSGIWPDLRAGDPEAFRALFHRHSDAVYNFAFRRTGSWAVADEVVQATFTALWRRVSEHRVDELRIPSARPVLFAMARDECSNQLRGARRRARLVERIESQPVGTADNTADWVAAEATMTEIRKALRRLPRSQREVIELVIWAELSLAEAAEVLGVPVGTVKSRLKRARDRLLTTPLAGLLHGPRGSGR